MQSKRILTDAQLKSELKKCEYCAERACKNACPADCSPADFIMAARLGSAADYRRAAALILEKNPLGGVCGMVCPDWHCQKSCVHKEFDSPVNIPAIQATIIAKAKALNVLPNFVKAKPRGKKIAVIGSGPAGLTAAVYLRQKGYSVQVFESEDRVGGSCNLIPEYRLPREVLESDLKFLLDLAGLEVKLNTVIKDPEKLLAEGFDAVLVAVGLQAALKLGIENEELAVTGLDYLKRPGDYDYRGRVAVIGGGATAADCAITAKLRGAKKVEMFALEKLSEMPLTSAEMKELVESGVEVNSRIKVTAVKKEGNRVAGIATRKVVLAADKFSLANLKDVPGTDQVRDDFDHVIVAIGSRSAMPHREHERIFYAGDCAAGPTTVVEAVASGKNAGRLIDACLAGEQKPQCENWLKSAVTIPGYVHLPVSLETDFFGRKISSPFLLSAGPPSDGLEQMREAYRAGWPGGIMKTSFASGPIHIPGEYMHLFNDGTYGNCDNVSGHLLDRVCREITTLTREFPDRLTIASTGGPVTGNDAEDRKVWQDNTRRLEEAGAMAIEYSLSCPQGGEGTEGDIVSQSAELTAKIIGWVMETGDGRVPKLFKLTPAVTAIETIVKAVKEVLDRYPNKKAGITLANSFPTLCLKTGKKENWEEGIIVGMSGEGLTPISYLSLAKVANLGVMVSGNGGAMNYKAAADFLALGAKTVQFCTIVMKYGYGIINELNSGLSHLMEERNIASVRDLIGITRPDPITDFMDLSPVKKIPTCNTDLCLSCGNCTRCSYRAITLDEEKHPVIDPEKCIGCSLCVQKCFSGALSMRDRTPEEAAALKEN